VIASARTKAAKRRNKRARNNAMRVADLKLRISPTMGVVAAADYVVEEADAEREKRDQGRIEAKRISNAWPCDTYHRRREITDEQHRAALRLFGDFMSSGLNPWASGGDGVPNHGDPRTPGQGPTYVAYRRAMTAVGIRMSAILSWVVLAGHHASEWAAVRGLPERDGKACLRFSLDALAEHYWPRR
jgi:hypothetical protein